MAWAQGDLTSSLSIVIALAACLSATTSEGRSRGGPGATGQCWGDPQGRCGCLDVSAWASLLCIPRGAQLQVPACLSLLILELLHQRLNFAAGQEDLISAAALPALASLQGLCCSMQGWLQRGQGHRHHLSHGNPHYQSWQQHGAMLAGWSKRVGTGGCRELGGQFGGKLVMRERAGNFRSGRQGCSQGPSPDSSVSAVLGLLPLPGRAALLQLPSPRRQCHPAPVSPLASGVLLTPTRSPASSYTGSGSTAASRVC